MNLVIFEDNNYIARKIELYILKHFGDFISEILVSDSLFHVLETANNSGSHGIYLLDILIYEKDEGIQAAREIHRINPRNSIIFMTQFPEKILYNTESKLNAVNFIIKRPHTFLKELKHTLQHIILCETADTLLIYGDSYSEIRITIQDIFYIETIPKSHKIRIVHARGCFELRLSLNEIVKHLNNRFVRCHNSYIVNLDKIESINHKNRMLHLSNGCICYFSYTKGKRLFKAFKGVGHDNY